MFLIPIIILHFLIPKQKFKRFSVHTFFSLLTNLLFVVNNNIN